MKSLEMMMKTKIRPRIKKGILVCSTNKTNKILSKRLIVNVFYKNNYNVVKYIIGDVRTSISQ